MIDTSRLAKLVGEEGLEHSPTILEPLHSFSLENARCGAAQGVGVSGIGACGYHGSIKVAPAAAIADSSGLFEIPRLASGTIVTAAAPAHDPAFFFDPGIYEVNISTVVASWATAGTITLIRFIPFDFTAAGPTGAQTEPRFNVFGFNESVPVNHRSRMVFLGKWKVWGQTLGIQNVGDVLVVHCHISQVVNFART